MLLEKYSFINSLPPRRLAASLASSRTSSSASPAGRTLGHACSVCHARFPTERALASHCRAKHGHQLGIKQYIDGSGVCPSCGTQFRTRLRCIAHLSDRRRPRCANWVLANCRPLASDVLSRLDEKDREALREAWSQGHTHALARGPAPTREGKRIGRCR